MLNSYQESIAKAEKDIEKIRNLLKDLHQDFLDNATAFRNLLQSTGTSNLKEFNRLVAENNKLKKENTTLKSKITNTQKDHNTAIQNQINLLAKNQNALKSRTKEEIRYEQVIKNSFARQDAQRKKEEQLLIRSASAYNKLDSELKKVSKDFQDLSAKRAQGITLTTKEIGKLNALEARLKILGGAYKRVNRELITASGGVNRASTSFDSLGFSVAQITRESPAFLNSLNTGFMAISNNIPILVDEITKLNLKNKDLIAQGKPTENVLKKVGAAFFSWQSLISAAIVALTVLGPRLIRFIAGMGRAEGAILSTSDALEKLNDSVKSEIGTIIRLTQRLKDVNISEGERLGIITELNEKFPEFNTNVLKEKDNTELVNQAIDDYIALKVKQVKARELEKNIIEETISLEEKEVENQEEFEKFIEKATTGRKRNNEESQRQGKILAENLTVVNKKLKENIPIEEKINFLNERKAQLQKNRSRDFTTEVKFIKLALEELESQKKLADMKSKLNGLLGKEDELIEGTVEHYRKLISANEQLIIEKKTIKDLDEVRRLQAENKEYQKQIDIILNNKKGRKKQQDATLELMKISAAANKKLIEDEERTFSNRTELLDQLVVRRMLINERILKNDLKAAGKNDDLQKLAHAKFIQRLEKDLQEQRTLRNSIQKDQLDDIKENLKAIEDAEKRVRDRKIQEANGDKDKLKQIEKEHFEAVLQLQSNYIAEVLRENENLTEEQINILVAMLTKMGAEMAKAADKTKNNLKDIQKQFKDIFATVTDTFSNAFGIDTSKFNFIFDELAKDFDKLDETSSELFSSDKLGAWGDAAKEIIGGVLNANLQRYEFQIEAARRARDTILNDELATEEHKRAARRKFEADERRIRTERARQERENTLIQIAVDSSVGALKAYLSQLVPGDPTSVIRAKIAAGIALGFGAVQAAFVASQPLPKFATGTMNAPEGLAYTDEKGAELHTDKKGNIKDFGSSKGARIKYLEEGDKIYTASKTKEILSNLTSSELQNAIFNLNMRSNDEILKDNVADMVLLNEIKGMKSSNEKVWREVKKLAERPINIDNELYLTDNRPY